MSKIGELKRKGLIAGDYPTKVQEITITGPAEFKRGDVVALTDDESYALVDSDSTIGATKPIGIITDDVVVADAETSVANIYVKGEFVRRFLQFGGNDTFDTHKRYMTEIGLLIRESRL